MKLTEPTEGMLRALDSIERTGSIFGIPAAILGRLECEGFVRMGKERVVHPDGKLGPRKRSLTEDALEALEAWRKAREKSA